MPIQLPGRKDQEGKPMMQLIIPDFLLEIAQVMTFGANKYGELNWRGGIRTSKLYGALLRHVMQAMKGEVIDAESGCHALAHVAANCMMIMWMEQNIPELDDQPCD